MDFCRVCKGLNVEQFLDLGEQPYCNSFPNVAGQEPKYPLRVWFCHSCNAVQLDHVIPKEEMFLDYKYVSGTTKTLRDSFQQATDKLVSTLQIGPNDLVIDIGSNDGTWLKCYPDCRKLGVEPSNVAQMAIENGIPTCNQFFNYATARKIAELYGFPKLVTGAGVFLHLEELQSVVDGIRYLLEPGGTFYLQVMYIGDMVKHTEFDLIYHEHLNYWSFTALTHLFERNGLEVNDVSWIPIHGGSLELWVTKQGAKLVKKSVDELLEKERRDKLNQIDTYRAFSHRIHAIDKKLTYILEDFKYSGKTVYAFGAPAKGATLLNSFDIDCTLVKLAVEKNPLKVGRYIAGTGIKIVDEDSVSPPDAYLMLPWNFVPEFIEKKHDYLMNGGAFIVPIPVPKVITKASLLNA